MNTKNDGGPAFPGLWRNASDRVATSPNGEVVPPWDSVHLPGMSLRDYFAGLAMQGSLASYPATSRHPASRDGGAAREAEFAYAMADAMIEARKK